ncbi:hxcR [Symbiodinium sp. CCMP2592]|nr:hxcR [Symbiodinium sp. CCMP2592]
MSIALASVPTITLAADAYMLMSIWKPILLFAPFVGWAWMISTVLDKHAQRFFLGQEKWNAIHIIFGVAALILVVALPVSGIAGFAAAFVGSLIILGLDILIFVSITNKDTKVPEGERLTLNMKDMSESREAKKAAKQIGSSELNIVGANKMTVQPPPKDTPELGIRVSAEQIVIKGFEAHASQIDILPANESTYAASYLVDGVRQAGDPIAAADAIQIIDFWKKTAGLDVNDRRRKLTGQVTVSGGSISSAELKLNTSGSKSGMRMSLIFNPAQAVRRKASDLGMLDQQLDMVKNWASELEHVGGTVLLCAPSDNGRTTMAYSIMKLHDAYTSNIQSIEYEIEDQLEGIKQIQWDSSVEGPDFATTVRSTLRRDPDIVSICDLPDVETAQTVANSDLERTRVYLNIRTDSALKGIQTYVQAVGDPKLAAKGLRGVVACKLVRVLCGNCKVPYQPTPDMLKKLGLPEDKVSELFKKGGQVLVRNKPETCSVCAGVGYSGQTGCFGIFPIGDEERAMIIEGNWNGLRAVMRKRGFPSVQQAALRKAVMGITSIEEVTRITAPKKSSSSKATAKA